MLKFHALAALVWASTVIAQACQPWPAYSNCLTVPASKEESCLEEFARLYISREDCTITTTIGAATAVVTETVTATTFVTPTVTFLQTRTFSNTSTTVQTEQFTTVETGFTFDITTTTETVPTLTITEDPITVTASAGGRRRVKGRYYRPRLDPDCSCFLTRTCTATVTGAPDATITEFATATTTEFRTITFNSTVSRTIVANTTTTTVTGSDTVTLFTTETISGEDFVTVGLTTVTVQSTVTAPAVQLSSPTPIYGNVVNGSDSNYDDVWTSLTLPFPITLYNITTSLIYLSINGFISLDQAPGTSFINSPLPVPDGQTAANFLPDTSICALWDDLYIYAGTQQGIYYQVDGTAPARTLTFEYYTSAYQRNTEFYHFLMRYDEATPGVITFRYLEVFGGGVSATIGAQARRQDLSVQWSFDTAGSVAAGQTLVLDTNANTLTSA
ncbi:hypothetical protein Dda_6637 [Drechslerella dactyloides]|uniref:Uncharacterized protein n=1 Tax=Drechslerella dactyloides TaxID=74499 RepID=A0AAD6IUA6_DREDA|nr:hypothetical protein Dda_6637 [Drechslerella dactyloides]